MFGDAESYQRFMGRWSLLAAPLLVDFTDVGEPERVLDVGSGTGSLAFSIAKQKVRSHVLGIDPSKEYVAYANSRNPFPDRVSFQIGDAQQLRFPDAEISANCRREESASGEIINMDTGQPASAKDPCVTRGATVGYNPQAHEAALKSVQEFFTELFAL